MIGKLVISSFAQTETITNVVGAFKTCGKVASGAPPRGIRTQCTPPADGHAQVVTVPKQVSKPWHIICSTLFVTLLSTPRQDQAFQLITHKTVCTGLFRSFYRECLSMQIRDLLVGSVLSGFKLTVHHYANYHIMGTPLQAHDVL